jgi:hypothetical protein
MSITPGILVGLSVTRALSYYVDSSEVIANLESLWTKASPLSGFSLEKKPPFKALKRTTLIPNFL